ncbi:MAG: 4Fe-4S dicluster domain-containing protein [Bacteroidales bacterium]|jgi:coenzyme F420-reducing hydrogenase beta subunit|nr:4Fe-4S dicluster domain-containing protein [Bacteroidales bacterium]
MIKILEKHNCCGCGACAQICPKQCVSIEADNEGFLYSKVDESKCIDCGLCEKTCPILNPSEVKPSLKQSFAFINCDETIRYNSSSGGAFSALAGIILRRGGKVFGARYDSDFNVVHSFIDKEEDLELFRGSKYTQSAINQSFVECKSFLDSGVEVLFTGTPCQIGGLKAFLKKDYDNLITIDLICHGVPSPLLWRKYVEYREKQGGAKVTRTSFRRKNDGWKKYSMWFAFANHIEYCRDLSKDPYMQMFLKDICLRPSCYDCKFKTIDRESDITMADFWGVQNEYPEIDDDKGVSFVVIHSEKGRGLFDSIGNSVKKSVPLVVGLKYNPSMVSSVVMPNERGFFFKDLEKLSFEKMIKKYVAKPWYAQVYKLFRRCVRKVMRIVGVKK